MPAPVVERPAWAALRAHHATIRDVHLRALFADDPKRGERLTAEAAGLYLDYSKNRLTDETLRLLLALAEESNVRGRIDAMFRGERINTTENRPVLHVALRAPRSAGIVERAGSRSGGRAAASGGRKDHLRQRTWRTKNAPSEACPLRPCGRRG